MRRLLICLVAAGTVWTCAAPFAAAQEDDEFLLPPVELSPDRSTGAEPIPPVPDEREAAAPAAEGAETVEAKPVEADEAEAPAPPAEKPKRQPRNPRKQPKAAPGEMTLEAPEPITPAEEVPATPAATTEAPAAPAPEPGVATEEAGVSEFVLTPITGVPAETGAPEGMVTAPEFETEPMAAPEPAEPMPRADVQAEAAEAQTAPNPDTTEVPLAGLREIGLVEERAMARKRYRQTLEALKAHYDRRGNAQKVAWVEAEIAALQTVPQTQYLTVAEVAGPDLTPSESLAAADQLYEEGLHYKNYPAFPPGKKDYLVIALEKFETIIEKYPTSDKIDDAAFRMGETYGGWYFEDWVRAVQAYERAAQWNPVTSYPALLNAAQIYEQRLLDREKAVQLYRQVIAQSPDEEQRKKAAERIRTLTAP